jgi:Fe2+ or Zn2+ uptake regulation protein
MLHDGVSGSNKPATIPFVVHGSDLAETELEFVEYLQQSGFRITIPRRVILRAALAFDSDFDAEQLLEKAKSIDPIISLTTIYRTLPILMEAGILIQSVLVDKKQRYRFGSIGSIQIYLECAQCGKVESVPPGCIRFQLLSHLKQYGFFRKPFDYQGKGSM